MLLYSNQNFLNSLLFEVSVTAAFSTELFQCVPHSIAAVYLLIGSFQIKTSLILVYTPIQLPGIQSWEQTILCLVISISGKSNYLIIH